MWNELTRAVTAAASVLDDTTGSVPATAALAVAAVVGLGLIAFSRRRVGQTPFCRRCGYNLTGRVSDRCCECGTDVTRPRVIRIGKQRLSPLWLTVGLALLFGGGLPSGRSAYAVASRYDWYQLKPMPWVLADLRGQNAKAAGRAARRIAQLAFADKLSDRDAFRAADACLDGLSGDKFRDNGWWNRVPLLGLLYSTRGLSSEQTARLFETYFDFRLEVRKIVREGDPVPIRFKLDPLSSRDGLYAVVQTLSLRVDEREVNPINSSRERRHPHVNIFTPPLEPGAHLVRWEYEVRCFEDEHEYPSGGKHVFAPDPLPTVPNRHRFQRVLTKRFQVRPKTDADPIRLVRSVDLDDQIAAALAGNSVLCFADCLVPWRNRLPSIGIAARATISNASGPPTVLALVTSSEAAGFLDIVESFWNPRSAHRDQRATLTLESDRDLAAKTIHLYEIWGGRVTLETTVFGPVVAGCGGVVDLPLFRMSSNERSRLEYLDYSRRYRWRTR